MLKTKQGSDVLCQNGTKNDALVSSLGIVDAKDLFLQLHQKALSLGLQQEQFHRMPQLMRIRHARKMEFLTRYTKCTLFILIILSSVIISWAINFPVSSKNLARFWLKINGENPKSSKFERQKCLLRASNKIQDLARPPIDCGFCVNVSDVIKVRGLLVDDFREKFAYSGHPVIVQDGTANWSALDVFNFGFFKDLYQPDSNALRTTEANCQFFPYKTEFKNLGDVFLMDERRSLLESDTAPWYIGWSNCDAVAGNLLRSHYDRPYFLPRESESSKTDWIFMGSPGYGAHMHVDHVSLPSWQAQITGHKQWTLQPPPECYGVCGHDLTVTVHPGEIIVLDTNKWYHSTQIVGDDISITIGSEFD